MKSRQLENTEISRICDYLSKTIRDYEAIELLRDTLTSANETYLGLKENEIIFDKNKDLEKITLLTYDCRFWIYVRLVSDNTELEFDVNIDNSEVRKSKSDPEIFVTDSWRVDRLLSQRELKVKEMREVVSFLKAEADYLQPKLMPVKNPTWDQLNVFDFVISDFETRSWVEFDDVGNIHSLKIANDNEGCYLSLDHYGFVTGWINGDNSSVLTNHGKRFNGKITNLDELQLLEL